jgi:DNA-binding transcriptional ArsR family regulator
LSRAGPDKGLFIYGGRSADASIVPGEAVPDALYLALKALADPTRLRILHYLEQEPQTPSELARTLRLRPPTVIHHLNSLRLAGLVYVTFGHGDKRYAARTSRVAEMYLQLRRYLGVSELSARDEPSGRPPYVA